MPFWQKNVDVLEGKFAFTAGDARGTARAIRLIDGEPKALGIEPFSCGGESEPPAPPPEPEDTPEIVLEPEDTPPTETE